MDFLAFIFIPSFSLFLSAQLSLQTLGRVKALRKLPPCSLRFITSPSNLEIAGWIWRHIIGARNTLLGNVQLPSLSAIRFPCDLDNRRASTMQEQKMIKGGSEEGET